MTMRCIVFPVWDLPFLLFLFFRTRRLISFSGLFGVAGFRYIIKFSSFVFAVLFKCFCVYVLKFSIQKDIVNTSTNAPTILLYITFVSKYDSFAGV